MFTLKPYQPSQRIMLNSLKNRFLAWFILVAIAIACIVFPLNYFHKKEELAIRKTVYELNSLHIAFIKDLQHTGEFLSYETTNPDFFITGESSYLDKHKQFKDSLKQLFDKHLFFNKTNSTLKNKSLQTIWSTYSDYCQIFDSIVYYIYQRGYRDFALEGEMIGYLSKAEKNPKLKNSTHEIRKYEREYLNRNDPAFVPIVNDLVDKQISTVLLHGNYSLKDKQEFVTLLNDYISSFYKLVALDDKIGLKSNTGLKAKLNCAGDILEQEIINAVSQSLEYENAQITRLNSLFAFFSILLILGAIAISIYLSKHLVSPLEQLNHYISKIAENDFNYSEKLNLRKSSTEIREIYKAFRNMAAQLKIREKQRDTALSIAYENEKRYRHLSDMLPQSIFETDRLGNLIYANKTWYKTFGYTQEDIEQGLNLIEILNTDTNNHLFGNNKIENSDYIAIRKDRRKFPASVYSDTIIENDKIIGRRGIIIDSTLRNKYIETLRKETVKAVTSDKQKSSFLANMSHEIRTPMNSIIGFANLLSAQQIPEEQKKEFIKYIQSSGQILLNLIDDIIDVAKIEAGEIKIKPGKCSPVNIINELCNTFEGYKTSIGKEHLKIITFLPEEKIIFRTDPFRLRQILSNLISNAIKYTEQGNVTIRFLKKNDRFLEFSVEDTGIGLTQEELNVIFERFRRTKTSENKNISGTGLGLAISKNLVELLSGQMWVSSDPDVGTKFWFELPYIQIESGPNTPLQTENSENLNQYNWHNRTILIAEDDDNSYAFLKQLLNKTNAHLVRAVNGKEVVEAVKFTDDIDIVLMDIQMPSQNGYEATRLIKEIKPHLPVIAQTAYAMEGDKEKSIMAGCDDYIAKPIQPRKLLAKINQFLIPKDNTSPAEIIETILKPSTSMKNR
jgi:PAS domain S-box-containing protein